MNCEQIDANPSSYQLLGEKGGPADIFPRTYGSDNKTRVVVRLLSTTENI